MSMTLQEALNSLPTDPDEIAARLVQEGCVMVDSERIGRCANCPVAIFLSKHVGKPCLVSETHARLASGYDFIKLPRAASEFIRKFENHEYPQLEACAS